MRFIHSFAALSTPLACGLVFLLAVGCDSSGGGPDGGRPIGEDAGTSPRDAGRTPATDAGPNPPDGAAPTLDGGAPTPDAGPPLSPSEILLPTGERLAIPTAPDPSGTYECSAPEIRCVPSEYATPQAAADVVEPGDTVVVEAGRYANFVVTRTGAAGSPIRFIGRPGTIIDQFTTEQHGIVLRSAFDRDFYVDYIQLVGFRIEAPPRRCIYLTKAIASRPSVGHLIARNTCVDAGSEGFVLSQMSLSVVEDNVILNAGNGSGIDSRDHGIYLSNGGTGNSLVRRNVIMGSSTNGIHFNGDRTVDTGGTDGIISGMVLDGNVIVGNGQNGFNMDGVQASLFINNVFYGNSRHAMRGYAIDGSEGPRAIVAINNTFIENNSGVKLSDSLGGHVVFNNLFVDMRDEPIVVPSADLTAGSNVTSSSIEFVSLPVSLEGATPAQIAAFDFRATSAGRAELVDQGQSMLGATAAPSHDLRGLPRSGLPDIGAVEH